MGAVRFCTANLLRRRLVGLVAIAALIAIAGAVTLAAFAGARRTDTAYPRLLDRVHALDVLVAPDFGETVSVRDLGQIPVVTLAADAYGFGLVDWDGLGELPPDANFGLGGFGLTLAAARSGAEQPRVSEGRLPRNDRAGEIFVNEASARTLGVHVGSRVHYSLYEFADLLLEDGSINPDAVFTPVTFTVVGIGTTVDDLLINENQDAQSLLVSPAFVNEYRDRRELQGRRCLPRARIAGSRGLHCRGQPDSRRRKGPTANPRQPRACLRGGVGSLFGIAAALRCRRHPGGVHRRRPGVGAARRPRRGRRFRAGCARGAARDPGNDRVRARACRDRGRRGHGGSRRDRAVAALPPWSGA